MRIHMELPIEARAGLDDPAPEMFVDFYEDKDMLRGVQHGQTETDTMHYSPFTIERTIHPGRIDFWCWYHGVPGWVPTNERFARLDLFDGPDPIDLTVGRVVVFAADNYRPHRYRITRIDRNA
jgi:hypothetical protein